MSDPIYSSYSSPTLIAELANTLAYAKFSKRIAQHGTSITALVARYEALVTQVFNHAHAACHRR